MIRALPSPRVVLIALDASPQSLTALETAAKVAARLNAELRGMYVEDINLMRTAALPFACAITSTGQSQPLTPEAMEGLLRRHADIARSAVESAGVRSNIAWSFSVVRGTVHQEIMRAASLAEFVAVGRSGWSQFQSGRIGSVVRSLIDSGATSLLMVAKGGIREPLALIYDGSPCGERAIALAAALNGKGQHPVTVVSDFSAAEKLKTEIPSHWRIIAASPEDFRNAIRNSDAKTVLIPATAFEQTLKDAAVIERADLSLFLVR
jgi:nucleotide-binding universal stress UspA family protein